MRTLLVYPPQAHPTQPFLCLPALTAYLRANGFKTYIVTGGGQDFVRVYSEEVYGSRPSR